MFNEVEGLAEGMDVEVEVETEEGNALAMAKITKINDETVPQTLTIHWQVKH